MDLWLIYLLLGAFAGLLAGLLGVGGGLVIVPVLVLVFRENNMVSGFEVHVAVASSLVTIIVTSISSIYTHHQRSAVRWDLFARLLPGLIVGGVAGVWLVGKMSTEWLGWVFALFEIMVAVYMLSSLDAGSTRSRSGKERFLGLSGAVVGVFSTILGIGGGTLTVPLLNWHGISIHQAVATSAACGLPIALVGMAGFMVLSIVDPLAPVDGYIYWPAVWIIILSSFLFARVGACWAHVISPRYLKKFFAGLLLLLGLRMLF
ncbi:MAG: sulfite exporter TauE/SafE family protein [Gammaproteobacteria bacterium]|nr:sulfite exporter TauE/SafE family protein [Gammaproteobacteria bacterium]